jgi:hypothetical protein
MRIKKQNYQKSRSAFRTTDLFLSLRHVFLMGLRQPSVEPVMIASCKGTGAALRLSELSQMDLALRGKARLTKSNGRAFALKAAH